MSHVVSEAVILADSSTVPPLEALILKTKVGSVPAETELLNLTPTCITLIISSEAKAAGVASRL